MIPEQWTSSLTTGSRKFREVWDRTGRNSQNQICTYMVKMILKLWYITWEGVQRKEIEKPREKKIRKYDTKRRTLDSWLYYSSYTENDFYILYFQLFFQTTLDRCLHSKIRLVLSPTLYKFIVWACWAKTQSCFEVQAKTGPYKNHFIKIKTYIYIYIYKYIWTFLDIFWVKSRLLIIYTFILFIFELITYYVINIQPLIKFFFFFFFFYLFIFYTR